jgi:hypothetical protein
MTQLTNKSPASTYGDLLTCTNAGSGLTTVQSNLQDGLGNNSPILIATTSVNFDRGLGQFQLDAVAVTANSVDINSMCQPNPVALGNASIRIPKGTTVQRPGGAVSADLRFNTDINNLEFYTGTTWQSISAGGSVTSVSGTAGQINVANPTTTPVISLPSTITGVNTITTAVTLSLNATFIDLNAVSTVNITGVGSRLTLQSAVELWFYNNTNTFKTAISGLFASQDKTYYLPGAGPLVNNQALTCNTLGVMSWSSVQLMASVNVVANSGLQVNKRYIVNSVGPINLALPINSAIGDIIEIVGNSAIWTLLQNAGQTIHFGSLNTTTGVTGSLAATVNRSCVKLVCVTANTDWVVSNNSTNLVVT